MSSNHYNPRKKSKHFDYTAAALKRIASGRWLEILQAAGMPAEALVGKRGRPCPRCGGTDRYCPMIDLVQRGAVLCRSCFNATTAPRCGDGIATLQWWFACDTRDAIRWLAYYLGLSDSNNVLEANRPIERRLSIPEQHAASDRLGLMAEVWRRNMRPKFLERAAELLGLRSNPLERLAVGWSPEQQATSWPMRNAAGDVIGVRLRCPKTAQKWAVKGSKAGLFFPMDLLMVERCERLIVCEGPTDTAAILSVGLCAIGVPSAGCGIDPLLELCRRFMPERIQVMADIDKVGIAGAERIANALMVVAPVSIVTPPMGFKDSRAWVVSGANKEAIVAAGRSANERRMTIRGEASQ